MSFLNDLPPRRYNDLKVPANANGEPMTHTVTESEYNAYISWLADHLFSAEISIHRRQCDFAQTLDALDPEVAVFRLSDTYGYSLLDIDDVERAFKDGVDWYAYDALQRQTYAKCVADGLEIEPFEECSVSRVTWERMRDEWMETQTISHLPAHADIPYRALLGRILRRVVKKDDRVALLRAFYDNFDDNASK